MPKSDTWPGGVAMEPLSNMDSAGSCDSVISVNSACSEDSMEHLSAEERACLMYLEETIEALEVQEDSGFSNDEPETERQRKTLDDIAGESGVPTLVSGPPTEPSPRVASADSGAEQLAPDQTSVPQTATETETAAQLFIPSLPDAAPASDIEGPSSPIASGSADIDLNLIPPPMDFMDEPPPQPEAAKDPPSVVTKPRPTIDLELLRRRASERRGSASPPGTPDAFKHEAPAARSPPVFSVTTATLPAPSEVSEPRSPPVVAPKPKRLPANIILKSHKVSDSGAALSPPASADRLLMDPQRVRMEALRKLGLLKSDEADPPAAAAPKLSPQSRSSWTAPQSPIPPASPPPSFVPAPPPALSAAPGILPAPAAFCDPVLAEEADRPTLVKQLTPPKVKSATLERTGPGLRSYMGSSESIGGGQPSLNQLRNSRPRPASLGSGKEFSHTRGGGGLQASRNAQPPPPPAVAAPPLPPPTAAGDSQKLPRSQGISVLICPRSDNGEKRRDALKKLGLLRD